MNAKEVVEKSRIATFETKTLTKHFEFQKSPDIEIIDNNFTIRAEIVEVLLEDFSNKDVELIRLLFHEEFKCVLETGRNLCLYQLCFYLYNLGNLEDIYRVYSAKYGGNNMDVQISIDRSMLYMNTTIERVINYVENDFKTKESNKKKYPEILTKLYDLKEEPDYESEEAYNLFISGYFYGHQNIGKNN
ncbi:hypothetical protein J8281_10495 [Aquimarina sp. U1-2]|uniref:hypothetical protein n=1 Tax=Aquimarina sp. U1-2 TaxID=2823141 RepID=UPI001AECDBCE|nr:hypothetical protein [Aquimarina sp. U1-2]MBP2832613.1 hypothetical protein [Aquimarina sp. U1-2]